jgi:Pyruvate/2-oxoacid:ferredoxin oxidoreductase gamma subunit
MQGEAHLIIGLEPLEALRACYFGSRENKTTFLVNSYRIVPLSVPVLKLKYPSLNEIVENLKQFSSRVIVLNASEEVKKLTKSIVMTNIYMLGYASSHDLIPLSRDSLMAGMESIIPGRFLEINKSVFEMGSRA